MSAITQRLNIAKIIFTEEERWILLKYEILSLFEFSKRKTEWFIYGFIVIMWVGVISCFTTLMKLSYKTENNIPITVYTKTIEDYSINEVCYKIKEASQTKLSPETIYYKVEKAANKYGIDKFFLLALIEKESNFNETVNGKDYKKTNSVGWSQMTKDTLQTMNRQYISKKYDTNWTEEDLKDPDKALEAICWYLNWLDKYYPDRIKTKHDLYVAYNAGPGNMASREANTNANVCMEYYKKYRTAYLNKE